MALEPAKWIYHALRYRYRSASQEMRALSGPDGEAGRFYAFERSRHRTGKDNAAHANNLPFVVDA